MYLLLEMYFLHILAWRVNNNNNNNSNNNRDTHRVRSTAMRLAAGWGELSNRKGRGWRKFENLILVGETRRPRYRYRKATHTQ